MELDDVIEEVTTVVRRKRKPPEPRVADEPLHLALLVDESGSMATDRARWLKMLNGYLAELSGSNILVTLTLFNSGTGCRVLLADVPLRDVRTITPDLYNPNDGTPLRDAIVETVMAMERRVQGKAKVLFAVLTDGLDNDPTQKYSGAYVKSLRAGKEEIGWTFVFLGADLSAAEASVAAQNFGFNQRNTFVFNKANLGAVGKGFAASTQAYMARGVAGQASQNFAGEYGVAGAQAVGDDALAELKKAEAALKAASARAEARQKKQ